MNMGKNEEMIPEGSGNAMSPVRVEKRLSREDSSPLPQDRPRPPTIKAHDRTVTPHTASLMTLFSRPPSPPKSPITPTFMGSPVRNGLNSARVPLMPCEAETPNNIDADEQDFEQMPLMSRTNNNNNYSSSGGSFVTTDGSLRDTLKVNNADPLWHYRNEAMLVENLTIKEQDTIADVFACYGETRLLTSTPKRENKPSGANSLLDMFKDPNIVPRDYFTFPLVPRNEGSRLPYFRSISENADKDNTSMAHLDACDANKPHKQPALIWRKCTNFVSVNTCNAQQIKTTLIGAVLYSLYSLVFCFAEASAITRPSHPNSDESGLLAPMALMGCTATLVTAPIIIAVLGGDYPAPYPALDMFMAPFLAQMAADVDEVLVEMQNDTDSERNDMAVFLATFVALNAFGMLLSGALCILASKVKLANLAGFLPYPVLCGFFSSVGISVWMSAFKVDTGVSVQKVLASGNIKYILVEICRHLPSLFGGAALYLFGPRNIGYLIGIISSTVVLAYLVLIATDTTIEQAQDMGFFWKTSEVVMADESDTHQLAWGFFGPPTPFSLFFPSVMRCICWPAFLNGLNNVVAMSVIYLLRCSLHAAALKKNDVNIKEIIAKEQSPLNCSETSENNIVFNGDQEPVINRAPMSVLQVLTWYAYSLLVLFLSGGFPVLPALSLGGIFARIRAHSKLPQFTAMFILLCLYLSDFRLVAFVPKFTFSSLLVMAAIDLVNTWFFRSYRKTASIYEWLVVPFIVTSSLLSGMLQSLGMGVAISTFIFVAQFYRSGVVKFLATGLTIRSSVERSCEDSKWLDQHGDLIQILVLKNYLYFGNATSVLNYCTTMFTDDNGSFEDNVDLPPIPKYILIDMSIVTGIDTSAVDVMAEICTLCKAHRCSLILLGIPPSVKSPMVAGGLTPSRQNRLAFMDDLDIGLGKAEDDLLKFVACNEERLIRDGEKQRHNRITSMIDNGLQYALRKIDEEHDISFAEDLSELEKYVSTRELEEGELLNTADSECLQRGLYFIESGLIKCSVDASASLTRGRQRANQLGSSLLRRNDKSIGQMNARSGTLARTAAILKSSAGLVMSQFEHTFRLGRFGPGWVIGTISEFTGQDIPGTYTCMTPCRVHHLTFEAIEELENEKPVLILKLYKMLAHLMARRQEMTIGQLSTLRSIMSSSAPTKCPSRRSMIAVNKAIKNQYY